MPRYGAGEVGSIWKPEVLGRTEAADEWSGANSTGWILGLAP